MPDVINVDYEKNANGDVEFAWIRFGPHYRAEGVILEREQQPRDLPRGCRPTFDTA
jgi:hypothetical protein